MGGLCSKRAAVDNSPSGNLSNGHVDYESIGYQSEAIHSNKGSNLIPAMVETERVKPFPVANNTSPADGVVNDEIDAGNVEPQLSRTSSHNSTSNKSKPTASAKSINKVSEVGSLINRAGTVGIGKAAEVLDTLGSSMASLHLSSGFVTGMNMKGSKISILAFEVANTIVKGANLMKSLSKENIKRLKEEVLTSDGVQRLISKDVDELLEIAAFDKREELKIFSAEVVRFGDRCKDPEWHKLNRYFDKLSSELIPQRQLQEEAESTMQQLMTLVKYTAELYHELNALDRFDQDYKRKLQEAGHPKTAQRGESLAVLRTELKSQRKLVRSLKKKSLWSKNMEEIIEKLVDIVHFLYLEIHDAFGGSETGDQPARSLQRLGPSGLALHYANVVSQIDSIVSRPNSVPSNMRDALYHGLPPNIKSALWSQLQSFQVIDELTIHQIKGEMEKTLCWLVPMAANTTKAHHDFGWVGEWANTGSEVNGIPAGQNDTIKIETLHHADKGKTEAYMLNLVVWLHHLVSQSKCVANGGTKSPAKSPIRSPNQKIAVPTSQDKPNTQPSVLTLEDQEMLQVVSLRKLTPGISKSQEFDTVKTRLIKNHRLCKSSNHSPSSAAKREALSSRRRSMPAVDLDIDKIKTLDAIDGVDTLTSIYRT